MSRAISEIVGTCSSEDFVDGTVCTTVDAGREIVYIVYNNNYLPNPRLSFPRVTMSLLFHRIITVRRTRAI